MEMKIVRRREDGGIEIEAPRVTSEEPMPAILASGNALRRKRAREQGRRSAPVYEFDYPVSGGWGYTREDACVIEMKAPFDDPTALLSEKDGYSVERLFVERRIYEEVIIHPAPNTPDLNCLRWNLLKQRLYRVDGREFDEMVFEVTGFLEPDLEFLRNDWESHDAYQNDDKGRLRHLALAAAKQISYTSTYWFDITSFFPRG